MCCAFVEISQLYKIINFGFICKSHRIHKLLPLAKLKHQMSLRICCVCPSSSCIWCILNGLKAYPCIMLPDTQHMSIVPFLYFHYLLIYCKTAGCLGTFSSPTSSQSICSFRSVTSDYEVLVFQDLRATRYRC